MMNKRGQFYIIAAVIMVMIILSMAGVSNYLLVKEEPANFFNLGKSLGLEGAWVIDYGIYNSQTLDSKITDFTEKYTDYLSKTGEEFQLVIVYGNENLGYMKKYSVENTGGVSAGGLSVPTFEVIAEQSQPISQGQTEIELLDNTYDVSLKNNENFFFVITTSKEFENYVYDNL